MFRQYAIMTVTLFFGVMARAGKKCNNQVPSERTSLPDKVASFPPGFYRVGDAAYQDSDVTIMPFTGAQCEDKSNTICSTFYFHNSGFALK
jgi:hypothetical protein